MDNLAVGIDLGTTNCCISIFRKGKITALVNPQGDRTTPSFIYYQPQGGIVIGKQAQRMSVHRPENGIYEVKRLVGRKYEDLQLQGHLKYLAYQVQPHQSHFPVILLKQKGNVIKRTPQELYTVILKELKNYSEEKLNQNITKAVITVPAYFNILQKEVTLAAAKDAGFNVLKLLNEPTAVALAYYFDNDDPDIHRCLVYDLGGGTFDIAVLEKSGSGIEVVCVSGDTQLGGRDLDKCLLIYIFRELKEKYQYDVQTNDDKRTLRMKCEQAKKDLSTTEETVIVINGMVTKYPKITLTITRKHFEDLAEDLFRKTIRILDSCLRNSNIPKESIQEVILCGGSTRIPKVQNLLSGYFEGKKLSKFVNPDECVAEGAAFHAAMLSTSKNQDINQITMVDVVPFSLGFASLGHEMNFLIKRNTKIPTSATHSFHTVENNQTSMPFNIYEGERLDARKNRLLGAFVITDLTPLPPGQLKVFATLSIDCNGILTATAKEKFGTKIKKLKINYGTSEQNGNSITGNSDDEEDDNKFRNFVRFKCYLIEYCSAIMYNMKKKKLKKRFKEEYEVCKGFKEIAENLEMHRESEVKTMILKCKEKCQSLVIRYRFKYMPVDIMWN